MKFNDLFLDPLDLFGERLEAADVADYLAQTREAPFRRTYRWLGEAVRVSEEENLPLVEAVNQVLSRQKGVRPLDDREKADLTSPDTLLKNRSSEGGPSPESVRAQCDGLREEIHALRNLAKVHIKTIDKGRKSLERTMKRYKSRP